MVASVVLHLQQGVACTLTRPCGELSFARFCKKEKVRGLLLPPYMWRVQAITASRGAALPGSRRRSLLQAT